jgi:hypothetical protein
MGSLRTGVSGGLPPGSRGERRTRSFARPKPAVGPNPGHARLKYCTARSCFCAAARDENVPRFFLFPVFASFLREYKRYSPDCSLRIIEKRMLCLYRSVGKEKDAGQLSSCAVEEPLSRRCSERPRTEIPHAASLQNLSSWARNTSPPMMHHPKQLRLISRLGTPDAQTNASTPRYF